MCAFATRQRLTGQGPRLYVKRGGIEVTERPTAVTAIGLLQLAKAGLLLGVVVAWRFAPGMLRSMPELRPIIYVAAHGRDTHGLLVPVVGLFTAVVGFGVLRLRPWARRSLIASTGLVMAIWAQRFYVGWATNQETLQNPLERETVLFLLFIDAVVFAYLVFYNDTPRAFAVDER